MALWATKPAAFAGRQANSSGARCCASQPWTLARKPLLTHSRSPPSRSDSSATPPRPRRAGRRPRRHRTRSARRHGAARRRCAPAPGRTRRSAHAGARYARGVDTVPGNRVNPGATCRHDASTAQRWTSPPRRAPSGGLTRRRGWSRPSFRCPPRLADVDRSLRRHPQRRGRVGPHGRSAVAGRRQRHDRRGRRHQRAAAAAGRSGAHRAVARRRASRARCCARWPEVVGRLGCHGNVRRRCGGGGPRPRRRGPGRPARRRGPRRSSAIERQLVGGECPYYGCIPSKMIDPRRRRARRGPAGRPARRAATPSPRLRARSPARIRDEATDDWDDQVAVDRLGRQGVRFVRGTGVLDGVRPGDRRRRHVRRGTRRRAQHRHAPAVPPIDGLADTPVLDQPRRPAGRARRRPRWSSSAAARSGWSSARRSPASGRAGHGRRGRPTDPRPRRSRSRASCWRRCSGARASTCRTGAGDQRGPYADGQFTVDAGRRQTPSRPTSCSSPPAARPNLPTSGSTRSGSTRPHARRSTPTSACASPASSGCGRSATSPARAPSRTCRCTRARSPVDDILGVRRPADGGDHAVPRVTFTDPEVGSRRDDRGAGARRRARRARRRAPTAATSTRGWIHGPGNDGLIKLVADADRGVLVGATRGRPARRRGASSMFNLAVHAEVPIDRCAR